MYLLCKNRQIKCLNFLIYFELFFTSFISFFKKISMNKNMRSKKPMRISEFFRQQVIFDLMLQTYFEN